MILRMWRGTAKPGEADNYINHLKEETFPKLSKINGFVKASILKREVAEGVEFLITTEWELFEAINEFAGEKADLAVVPEKVQKMMRDYDKNVIHYEIVFVKE